MTATLIATAAVPAASASNVRSQLSLQGFDAVCTGRPAWLEYPTASVALYGRQGDLAGYQQPQRPKREDQTWTAAKDPRHGELAGSAPEAAAVGGAGPHRPLQEEFRRLVRVWKAERGPSSSVRKLAAHPAYREIIRLGREAVPLLLAELEREADHWFLALHEITGANAVPEESRGRLKEMAAAWLRWGKENGFAW